MKKTINISLLIVSALILLTISCKKEPKDPNGQHNNPPDATMKDLKIILPDGANYDLTGHEVMAGGVIQPVSKDGKSKVPDMKGTVNIAYLFDKDDNVVMAGFITDSTATISAQTTAKVILFYATSAAFSVDTIAKMFINKIGTVPEAAAWMQNFSATWKANPLAFSKGTYMSSLNAMLKVAIGEPKVLNIRSRTSDVQVDDGDIRSGMQVFQDGLGQISIYNKYRRRAYAFIYKTQFKKEGSTSYTDITPATLYKELPIDATSGVTSTAGTVVSAAIGKGLDLAITKNGPVKLDLNDDESEAIYKVRVIGVGAESSGLTSVEVSKKNRLMVETLALDFLLPSIAMGIGSLDDEQKGAFVKAADAVVKITPGVYDELNKGNFMGALNSVLKSLVETDQGENLANLITSVIKSKVKDPKEAAKKAAKILFAIDAVLQGSDFVRIGHDIHASKQLEEWKVVARSSKVSLNPKEKVVIQNGLESFEAKIKNLGTDETNISYEWTTSGKYGKISDSKGHTGTVFTSIDKKVNYRANAGGTLTDGDNWEYIYVKASQGGKNIGSDTAKVNVKKNKQVMKPDGITLTGKKGTNNANEVRLYLELANKDVIVKPNTEKDYKVIWTTEGKYGKLLDAQDVYSTTLTAYDDNGMAYECQNDQAKNKEEIITARIYSKAKGETEYTLFDEVTGKVKIDNDEKKRILHVPLEIAHADRAEGTGSWCYIYLVATFAEDKDAKSYSLKFFDVSNVIGAPSGDSWVAGKAPYYSPPSFVRKGYDGSSYSVYRSFTYGGRSDGGHYKSEAQGWAEVTITLK